MKFVKESNCFQNNGARKSNSFMEKENKDETLNMNVTAGSKLH